ncbi:MAG: pentapeptide repeat-containing protein [Alphaproteobacteria bacterium]|nr:pentapeptide repeat-containing protein [Alphaproteobacteria bacterium]
MIRLSGNDATSLHRQGVEEWNQWVRDNPDAAVSFEGATFASTPENGFSEHLFPSGGVKFDGAKFKHSANFNRAIFRGGNVSFNNATFANDATFEHTQFGKGELSFTGAVIDGHASFHSAKFENKGILFDAIQFKASCRFNSATFLQGNISFRDTIFGGTLSFEVEEAAAQLTRIDFYGCVFERQLLIRAVCQSPPDFRSTTTAGHTDLSNLRIEPSGGRHFADDDDAKYRRMKEIAERNRHHEAALTFFAAERRAMRALGQLKGQAKLLDVLYDKLCDYGQSIWRPTALFFGLFGLFAFGHYQTLCGGALDAALLAGADSVPFVPTSRLLGETVTGEQSRAVGLLRVVHQVFSFVALFLIGVGLRNRFRL